MDQFTTQFRSSIEQLKDPQYTGANRCLPCTIVNSTIAVVLAVVVAGVLAAAGQLLLAAPAALAVLVVSAAAIYFKGYLVPGTPALTKQYFPPWLLRKFGKDPTYDPIPQPDPAEVEDDYEDPDIEDLLVGAGALEVCQNGADLCLTEEFQAEWRAQIERVRDGDDEGRQALLNVLDVEDEVEVEYEEHEEGAFTARADGLHLGDWESRAAYLADVAAGQLLPERVPDTWAETGSMARGEILQGLRLFLETCPECGSRLSFDTETRESCCTTRDVAAVTCEGCSARIFEAPLQDEQQAPPGQAPGQGVQM